MGCLYSTRKPHVFSGADHIDGPLPAYGGDGQRISDLELAVRASKNLEHVLKDNFGGKGRGIDQLLDSAQYSGNGLKETVQNAIRILAKQRNDLVHNHHCTKLADRRQFIDDFRKATQHLRSRAVCNSDCRSCSDADILMKQH